MYALVLLWWFFSISPVMPEPDAVVITIIDQYSLFQSCSRWSRLKCLRRVNPIASFLRFHTQTTHPPSTREKHIFFQSNEAFILQRACMDGLRERALTELEGVGVRRNLGWMDWLNWARFCCSAMGKKTQKRERENFKLSLIKLPSGQQALLWPVKCWDVSCAPPHCLCLSLCLSFLLQFQTTRVCPGCYRLKYQKSNFMNGCFSLDLWLPVLWLLAL